MNIPEFQFDTWIQAYGPAYYNGSRSRHRWVRDKMLFWVHGITAESFRKICPDADEFSAYRLYDYMSILYERPDVDPTWDPRLLGLLVHHGIQYRSWPEPILKRLNPFGIVQLLTHVPDHHDRICATSHWVGMADALTAVAPEQEERIRSYEQVCRRMAVDRLAPIRDELLSVTLHPSRLSWCLDEETKAIWKNLMAWDYSHSEQNGSLSTPGFADAHSPCSNEVQSLSASSS
jgi:hypothetical protein